MKPPPRRPTAGCRELAGAAGRLQRRQYAVLPCCRTACAPGARRTGTYPARAPLELGYRRDTPRGVLAPAAFRTATTAPRLAGPGQAWARSRRPAATNETADRNSDRKLVTGNGKLFRSPRRSDAGAASSHDVMSRPGVARCRWSSDLSPPRRGGRDETGRPHDGRVSCCSDHGHGNASSGLRAVLRRRRLVGVGRLGSRRSKRSKRSTPLYVWWGCSARGSARAVPLCLHRHWIRCRLGRSSQRAHDGGVARGRERTGSDG